MLAGAAAGWRDVGVPADHGAVKLSRTSARGGRAGRGNGRCAGSFPSQLDSFDGDGLAAC